MGVSRRHGCVTVSTRRSSRRATVLGALAAAGILVAVVSVVGVGSLRRAASSVSPLSLVGVALATLCWLTAWSLSFRAILAALGIEASWPRAGLLFLSTMFADYLTPSAQAGSVPVGGLLVSRATGATYATGMTAVAAFGALNVVPSTVAIAVSAAYLARTATLTPRLQVAVALLLGVVSGTLACGAVGWRYRRRLRTLARPLLAAVGAVAHRLPMVRRIDPRALDASFARVVSEAERLAWNRRQLGVCLCFSALGWLLLSTAFWLSLRATYGPVAVAVPLLVVPLSMTGNVLPLPGGVGGIEALLVALVVGLVPASLANATAAALVYRGVTLGAVMVLGGLALVALELRPRNGNASSPDRER